MANLLTLTYSQPSLDLDRGEVLVREGEPGGDLYVLESGRLAVERDGVTIAMLDQPSALIGEMAVMLGKAHTATVRAERASKVRMVRNAIHYLERNPQAALEVAAIVCGRLDATSALLVELSREHAGKPAEQGLLARVFSALFAPQS